MIPGSVGSRWGSLQTNSSPCSVSLGNDSSVVCWSPRGEPPFF
jgi:hypothetical protein